MAKRISKKLMIGLGSTLTFGTVGLISAFGVKSIIDATLSKNLINKFAINSPIESNFETMPNYNVATADMFIPTKNLKRFHFGNTQIGQKVTPWGWLGVFEDDNNVRTRIALTAWNGEIIWVNQDYTLDDLNVYDMQYDFNSNLIFVLRTKSSNGFYNGNESYPKVYLQVLDAKTGKKYKDEVLDTEFENMQRNAKIKLINDTSLLDGYESNQNIKDKTKNLYYLDVASTENAVLATWMPNYMQMARQSYKGNQVGSLPSFHDVINTWDEVATSFMFDKAKLFSNQKYDDKERKFELVKSSGIRVDTDGQGKPVRFWIKQNALTSRKASEIDAANIFLLTNPFFTTSADGNAFVMHLIGATHLGDIYHKTIGWKINLNDINDDQAKGEIYNTTYDSLQILTNNQRPFIVKSDQSWTMAKGWNPYFINANLRVNKNMFDENSIVFAYPYSSSSDVVGASIQDEKYGNRGFGMPVFNVAQILLNKNDGKIRSIDETMSSNESFKRTTNYDFGKQIDDYFNDHGNDYANSNWNNIYPYPSPDSFGEHNVNHLYNRLISVSPFDNTIIYAAKPNVRESIFGPVTTDNKDKWAGFWIANRWKNRSNHENLKFYHPLIVGNDESIVSDSDVYDSQGMKKMLGDINDLYRDGFAFDIASFYEPVKYNRFSLNLYFNQTGNGVNELYENKNDDFRTSKIGLLRNVLYDSGSHQSGESGDKGWGRDITTKFPGQWSGSDGNANKKLFATTINNNSFSSLIHSRANLEKWYPRTWANANFPSNMLKQNEIFSYTNPWKFAVATTFNTELRDQDWVFSNKESLDLVSAWRDYGENNQSSNYLNRLDRLIMRRPKIQSGLTSLANGLKFIINYELPSDIYDFIINKEGRKITDPKIQENLKLVQNVDVQNTSIQILSSWKDAYKMAKIASKTNEISQGTTAWNQEVNVTDNLDKKDNPNITFGGANNNNITRNNATALRLMLKLVKPNGTLPSWFNNNNIPDATFFNKAYPVEPAYSGETTFKDIVNQFANLKAQYLDLSDANNLTAAVGLGNIKIEAYLELNPKFAGYTSNADKIYRIDTSGGYSSGGKLIIDKNNNNQQIIYKDDYRRSRTIYDQSKINYQEFADGGFGKPNSQLRDEIQQSWATNSLNSVTNIRVTADYRKLADTLVRTSPNNTDAVFSFNYKNGDKSKIEIVPKNNSWFKNRFQNFNRILNLFVQFEYETTINGNNWTNLGSFLTDEYVKNNTVNNVLTISSENIFNIRRLRFKLTPKSNDAYNPSHNLYDPNLSIDIQEFNNDNANKYISNPVQSSIETFTINKDYILQKILTNQSKLLNSIQLADINNFIQEVISLSPDATNQELKRKVTLKFKFKGSSTFLDAQGLLDAIKNELNQPEPFALWNGTTGQKIISAKFELLVNDGSLQLVNENGATAGESDLINDVKSDLKTQVDLGQYINQLTSSHLTVSPLPTVQGQFVNNGTDIQFPTNSATNGFFAQMQFSDIKSKLLSNLGVKLKFKGYDSTAGTISNNWTDDLATITNYNPTNPEIIIGFEQSPDWNTKLVNGSTDIANLKEFSLKLSLPKLVKLPLDENQMITNFNNQNPFGGNTFKLEVDENNLTTAQNIVIEELKKASQGNTNADYTNLANVIEFQYQLGSSPFLSALELKKHLLGITNIDQSSNLLKMKITLKATPNNNPEFVLETNLAAKEFIIQQDDNNVIKKYIHGTSLEPKLNEIRASGSFSQITYIYPSEIQQIFQGQKAGLKLQYTFNDSLNTTPKLLEKNNDPASNWVDVPASGLPQQIPQQFSKIYLQILVSDPDKYVYGPDDSGNKTKGEIDLSKITVMFVIDKNWFTTVKLTNNSKNLNQLNSTDVKSYENSIFDQSPSLTPQNNSLRQKVKLTYQFNGKSNLDEQGLVDAIKAKLVSYNDSDQGIFMLFNGTNGMKIQATFTLATNDNTVQFVTTNNQPAQATDLTGDVLSDLNTQLNLSEYLNQLLGSKIPAVQGDQPGKLKSFSIPGKNGASGTGQLNGKSFDEIKQILANVGVNIRYKKWDNNQWSAWLNNQSDVTSYDPVNPKITLGFIVNGGYNIKLLNGNNEINDNTTFELNLSIPKLVKLPTNINDIPNSFNQNNPFSGNTFKLEVDQQLLTNAQNLVIEHLRKASEGNNATGNYANLASALDFKYQIADSQFLTIEELKKYLLSITNRDQTTNALKLKISIKNVQGSEPEFILDSPNNESEFTLQSDGNNVVKIYIHDQNIYQDLRRTTFSGNNKNLIWNWVNGISIDDQSGILQMTNRGNGLKVEYTFNGNATNNSGDITNGWVSVKPTTFDLQYTKIFLRLVVTDNKYFYENDGKNDPTKKIELDLSQIKQVIDLDGNWLNQSFLTSEVEIGQFDVGVINKYEEKVLNMIADQNIKQKVTINYSFNGQDNLDKTQLINAIKSYKNNNSNQPNLGILQLYNGNVGEQIKSKFAKAEPQGNYDLNVSQPTEHLLQTEKVITTIDFSHVLNWIKTIKVIPNKKPATANVIQNLIFPNIEASQDDYFHNQEWAKVEQALDQFGIIIQYRSLTNANKNDPNLDWKDDNSDLNDYDSAIGKAQIRFKFDSVKAKNIKLKLLNNTVVSGTDNNPTESFDINLRIRLSVKINNNLVFNYIGTPNVVVGNTKILKIDKNAEDKLVADIKQENILNNPEFANVNLLVKYQIGEAQIDGVWRTRQQFIDYLANETVDQITNKIVFKFEIDPQQSNDFEVIEDNYPLSGHEDPGPNTKIKYYINEKEYQLEKLANQVEITGTNIKPVWNWPAGLNINNQTSLIETAPGKGLQVNYTFDATATYNDQIGTDINNDWVVNQPDKIPADVEELWIRLIPLDGYVYGAANPNIHKVIFNLTRYIEVEQDWLKKSFDAIGIERLTKQELNALANKILLEINDVDLRNKVEIIFGFNGENNLNPDQLLSKIKQLMNSSNSTTYGILQLFNGTSGMKIQANFKIKDGVTGYKLLNKITQTEQIDYQDLNTEKVTTTVDLITSFQTILDSLITATETNNNQIQIQMPDFPNNGTVLSGRTWEEGVAKLQEVGIIVEYQAVNGKNNFGPWTTKLSEIKTYDPTINQFHIRFKLEANKASNIILKITNNDTLSVTDNRLESNTYALNLNLPLKLELDAAAIKTFTSNPASVFGNTKFLTIDALQEENLINDIIAYNEKNNPIAAQAAGRIEIQYIIGDQNNWLNRESFQDYLKTQPNDQTNNRIQFKFVIKSNNAPNGQIDFVIDDAIQELSPYQQPADNIKIPYYINKNDWEEKADNVTITGNNHGIIWEWNQLNVDTNNLVQVSAGRGLKIQFSTKPNIQYSDPESQDLTQGWSDKRPESLLIDTNDLYIRLVKANSGFVYQAQEEKTAKVHKVSLRNFKFLISVDRNWLSTKLIIANGNLINKITKDDLKKYEDAVLININPQNLKVHVGLRYQFNGSSNLNLDDLYNEIQKILTNFEGTNGGILQLYNGVQGLKIEAKFIIQNSPAANGREYDLFEVNNSSLENTINTDDVKTNIDLRPYINLLKQQPIAVRGADSTTGQLDKILMPNFPSGSFNLSGKSYDEAKAILNNLGIKFEARALGDGVSDQWSEIEAIKKYDPNNGKIQLRLSFDQQKAKNIVLSIETDQDQGVNNQPKEIELILQVPLKVEIDQAIVNTLFVNNNSISGNTRFIEIDNNNEEALIDAIIESNQKNNPNFAKLKGKLKIEYQIKNSQEWKERNLFKEFLKNTKTNWASNEIKFRFILVNNDNNDFVLGEPHEFILHNETIGNKAAAVKIYINENNYENLSDNISISGTNSSFTYNWPQGLPINKTTGQIEGVEGLQIQYTTKTDQSNQDYNNGNNVDPTQGWVNQPVNKIDPVNRYLAVQLVAKDGYVYGAQFKTQSNLPDDDSPNWRIHKVNVQAIVSEIEIEMSSMQQISFNGQFPDIDETQISRLEQQAKIAATSIADLRDQMKFEYKINLGGNDLFSFNSLSELKKWMINYKNDKSNPTAGLLKFNSAGSTQFATIFVRLQAIDENQYVVIDKNGGTTFDDKKASADSGVIVSTDNYATIFELQSYEKILLEEFVNLPEGATSSNISGFNPPGMEKSNENNFLAGKSFSQIKVILEKLGLIIEYKAPGQNNDQWVSQEQIQSLNDKNELLMRFRVNNNANRIANNQLALFAKSFKLKTKSNPTGELDVANDYATEAIKLKINLPILIQVDSNDLVQEKLKLKGNTWKVNNKDVILQEVQRLIKKAKDNNNTTNTNVENADLKIQFHLPELEQNGKTWFEIDEFVEILLKRTDINFNSNEIQVRWWIDENQADANGFRYKISDPRPVILQAKSLDKNSEFKMYIHKKDEYSSPDNIWEKLKAIGSTEDYVINGLDDWINMLQTKAQGLNVQFSNNSSPSADADWTTYSQISDLPKPLNPDKDLWFRYEVKDGYEYGDQLTNDPQHSDKVRLDTSTIKIILDLQSEWLNRIILTGNLYQLEINETEAKKLLIASGTLPTNQQDLVVFEYAFDNKNWLNSSEFKDLLLKNQGKKDDSNFILKREEIKVRFNLKNGINSNEYQMKINDELITPDNWAKYNVQLIDQQLNSNVKGYIEIKHLKDFVLDSFSIQGTNSKPKLIIKKRLELETLMQVYASDNLFDILISTRKKADGSWDWTDQKSILLQNNHFIDSEQGLIDLGVTLDANKQVALKFVSKNSNYDVYSQNIIQNDGYDLDISKNVQITVEIENPFTAANKTLGLWTRDNNSSKYYQGQGGFKIVIANKDTFEIENDGQTSAEHFLKNSNLQQVEKDALELVFHVFGSNPTDTEIKKVQESIKNYKDQNIWKSFDTIKENSGSDWSKDLGLKVGDYVAVALRVKEEFATQENPFVLKNNDYSMILPVMNDQSGTEKKPGRISGYKVNTDMIEIEQDGVIVSNIISSQLPPLDGWSELQKVDLKQDEKGNYLGVNLKLELYTQFHEDRSNRVLVSGSGLKLVQRQTNKENPDLISKGNYKDKNNADIKDKNNQTIQIWKDKNNRLSAPKKAANVTKEKLLASLGDGSFRMPIISDIEEKERMSLFRNQDLDLKLEANFGEGNAQLPDFYLDNDNKQIDIKEVVSKQIKFIVENEDKITYSWNQEAFTPDQIQYKAPGNNPEQQPEDGNAQIATIYKLIKKTDGKDPQEITGDTAATASTNIQNQLNQDFDGQLKFETTYISKKGHQVKEDGNNIYKFTELSNKDRIMVKIVAVDEDLFYVTDEPPLVINVNGLTEAAPDPNRLQYLRVKQGGLIDGQGSFKVLVSNPDNDNEDDSSILKGWKFMIRVWDKDPTIDPETNMRKIKINWTSDPAQIKGLANGDKVEWKLVSDDGNPVKDAYYNTIALKHQQKPDGNIDYRFGQVNYAKEDAGYDVIKSEIGTYPDDDNQYPEDSGFVISGLKPAFEVFKINQTVFEKIIKELNPFYVGFDHQGTINFDNQYLENEYWVNTKGEIYLKELNQLKLSDSLVQELPEIPIKEFLNNVTFFTQDPILFPYQNGFKFEANDVNIDNHLANGDSVWAQFNMVNFKDEDNLDQKINTNQNLSSLVMQLPDVSGLKNIVDPMSPFWYVLMALAGIATLGTAGIIAFLISRHKKLKGKN